MRKLLMGLVLCFGLVTAVQATTTQCLKASKVDQPHLVTTKEREGIPVPETKDRTILITELPDKTRIDFSSTGDQYVLGPMERIEGGNSVAYSGKLGLNKLLKDGRYVYLLIQTKTPFATASEKDIVETFILFKCKDIGILI